MKIVFMGDSLTYAYKMRRIDAFTSMIAENLGIECINKGISGDTTGGMLSRFREDVILNEPKYVHIMGGGNDLICDADLGVLKSNIMAMVHQAMASNITPILGTVVELDMDSMHDRWKGLPDYETIGKKMTEFSEWLIRFADFTNTKIIDYRKEFYNYYDKSKIGDLYLDGLHLNKKGNEILAKIFIDNFNE